VILKSKLKIFIIFFSTIFLTYYFIFNETNILVLIKNLDLINEKKIKILNLNHEKVDLEKKFNEFKNNSDYRELIVKEKLYMKNKSDGVIFYELDN
tara:strand:+ start:163 stop:450 length:288 start_codon:yes stop_codon:yes gene_type:complete